MLCSSLETLHETNKRSKSIDGRLISVSLETHQQTNNRLLKSLELPNNTPLSAPALFSEPKKQNQSDSMLNSSRSVGNRSKTGQTSVRNCKERSNPRSNRTWKMRLRISIRTLTIASQIHRSRLSLNVETQTLHQ